MSIIIREFQPSDQYEVKTLILNGLEEHFGFINPNLNSDLNDIMSRYLQTGHSFVVGEEDGEIVGTAGLVRVSAEVCRIVRIAVRADKRRAGIGRMLIEYLLQLASEKQFIKVLVETNLDWYDAIRLYERCGFQEYGRDEESVHLSLTLSGEER
ncbi:MAG: GNAT family N-acetyltransferase [Candidatus Promineifilaceae bacterium]